MLLVRPRVNNRLLVTTFWGSQKLQVDFQLCSRSPPNPMLFKGQLHTECVCSSQGRHSRECNEIDSGKAALSFPFQSKHIHIQNLGHGGPAQERSLVPPLHPEGPLSPQHSGHQSGAVRGPNPLTGSYQDSPGLESLVKPKQVRQQEHEGDEERGQ